VPTIVAFTGFEFGTENGIGAGTFDGATGVAGTDYKVVAGTPVVGSYVGQVTTLNNKNYFWNTTTLGSSKTDLVVSLRFMFSTLPTSANDFHSIDTAAGTDRAGFYYDPADQKIHAWILSATQAATSTIAVNTWYTLQFRYSCSANPNTLDWTFNGTAQTSVSNGSAGATTVTRYALGNRGGTNGVVNFDDTAVSVTNGDYPLPVYQVRMVGVDTAGTTTQIGTVNATVRFTANGTLDGSHSSSAILTALSEVPPTIGASASGVTQQTAGAGNAVEIPMATYTLTGGETIAGCRLYLAGWAASALAANLGFRAWNGTAETTLHGDTVATGFDNANIGWYVFMYSGVTNQTTLDALTARIGYSTDVSPTPGAHAVYAELLILPGAGGTTASDAPTAYRVGASTTATTSDVVVADVPTAYRVSGTDSVVSLTTVDTATGYRVGTTPVTGVTFDVVALDSPTGYRVSTSTTGQTFSVVVTDVPTGYRAGVSSTTSVTDVTALDSPNAYRVGASLTGSTFDTIVGDVPTGYRIGTSPATGSNVIIASDSPTGYRSGSSTTSTTYDIVISDTPTGYHVASSLTGVTYDVTTLDSPSGYRIGTSATSVVWNTTALDSPFGYRWGTSVDTSTTGGGGPVDIAALDSIVRGYRFGTSVATSTIRTPVHADIIAVVGVDRVTAPVSRLRISADVSIMVVTSNITAMEVT
jgi:hypothetical protein